MTLDQLDEALRLAKDIRHLKQSVEQWSRQGVKLVHLLQDTEEESISREDELRFIEATRDRMSKRLADAERVFALFNPTP